MTRGRDTARGAHGRVTGWLAWFAALNLLWLLLISAWIPEEAVLGLFASAVAATAAEAVREQPIAGFRLRARWLWRTYVLPWRALRESSLVLATLVRQLAGRGVARGTFRLLPIALPDDPHEQAAKRALVTAGESFSPNSYVLTIDTRRGVILKHELVTQDAP
jgi:hypothetical protein